MEFVDTLSGLVIVAGILFLAAYAIRHRGAVANWLNNFNHEDNTGEKADEVIRLRRRKEDIERRLKTLEGD